MEAFIISLLLFLSNANFSFENLNQNGSQSQDTSAIYEETPAVDENAQVECSAGGKTIIMEFDGL
ncbi:hypothetical protein [Haliscomenobacter sp.]|uniref:hypothetical protein n=1 Tax=Haliscomenobacter sp. TaxID=2717303 RepID=UPI003364B8FC